MATVSERAKELVGRAFGKSPREEFTQLIEQALLAERRLAAESENWISVDDQLPEPSKSIMDWPVLVVEKLFAQPLKGWYYGVGYFGDNDTNWRVEGMNGQARVTFWQPLPHPPVATPRGGE